MGDFLEATRCVKAGGQLIGERFNVREAVRARRTDSFFVEPLCVELSIFNSRYLGADYSGAAFKILWTVLRPFHELFIVSRCRLDVLLKIIGRSAIARCRMT